MGRHKDSFIQQKWKGKSYSSSYYHYHHYLEYREQALHSATAHHLLTNAQPVPKLSPALCAQHDAIRYGMSLLSDGISSPGHVPSRLLHA